MSQKHYSTKQISAAALRNLLKHAWLGHLRTLGTGFAAPHGHP